MQPLTPVIAGQFKAGQTLEQSFQILPNKCYQVLAVGVGISDMNVQIVALQPIPGVQNPVLAEDRSASQNASFGRGNCYKWPWPFGINAKAVYTAKAGDGMAAGRVYVK